MLTSSYLVTTKNLDAFFNALITAQAPVLGTQTNLSLGSSLGGTYLRQLGQPRKLGEPRGNEG